MAVVSLQHLDGPESKKVFEEQCESVKMTQGQPEGARAGQLWDSLGITTSSGSNALLNHRMK